MKSPMKSTGDADLPPHVTEAFIGALSNNNFDFEAGLNAFTG
jgi:hypothetical protein